MTVDLRNLETTWNFQEGGTEETSKKSIRASTAEAFIEELKILNLLNWKAKYFELGVCDGTQWSVEILTEGRGIKKYGDNKFPEEWDLFCRLIRQVIKPKVSMTINHNKSTRLPVIRVLFCNLSSFNLST